MGKLSGVDIYRDDIREVDIERYEAPSQTRALTLIDTSGNHYFLNYAYIVSGEYKPSENLNTLFFTSTALRSRVYILKDYLMT